MDRMDGVAAFGDEGTAGFQTGCIADVPIGGAWKSGGRLSGGRHAGWETRDTADLEVCGTITGQRDSFFTGQCQDVAVRWRKQKAKFSLCFPD
jgi:hypothetical protein